MGLGDGGFHYYPRDVGEPRDWEDAEQVVDAMRTGAEFFSVPSLYAPAVGDVVTQIVRAMDADWRRLPQPWADAYCYVMACIGERVGAGKTEEAA